MTAPAQPAFAILNTFYGLETIKNPDLAAELTRAVNEWLRAEWLDHDARLRASIVVPPNDATAAAAEIERVAGDSRFVQVLLPARAEQPYGHRRFFPLHAAAADRRLPLAIRSRTCASSCRRLASRGCRRCCGR